MPTKFFLFIIFILTVVNVAAQSPISPEQFLRYPLGTRFTRHHKILEYVETLRLTRQKNITWVKYGESNEGRDLILAFISSEENMAKLEEIRKNNLRISGFLKDSIKPIIEKAPIIVWLSYNIHGNEPASSEAAMRMMYELANPSTPLLEKWLKNIVVVIDPCLNPDGRDRYVDWYNSQVGSNYDPNPMAREHKEPWPQGRGNHYYMDLNRDWAWQTQTETKSRMVVYNKWMPQLHIDFHEQAYTMPYFFGPSAEPIHKDITQWQREFQQIISEHTAKLFDKNGWSYYTKENYDLFYPSYGDTYPMFTGAVGMTFEQGGIKGGIGIKKSDNDTLTLTDRIEHHYYAGLSAIEMVYKHQDSLRIYYKKYYEDNLSSQNAPYKTFILTSDDAYKINKVANLCKINGIKVNVLPNKFVTNGVDFFTKTKCLVQLKKYNLVIGIDQPQSELASVLLGYSNDINDFNTSDITAWGIPYSYGVDAYCVNNIITKEEYPQNNEYLSDVPFSQYGYIIRYNSFGVGKTLAKLLKLGVNVKVAQKTFVHSKVSYAPGTLIILNSRNPNNLRQLLGEATEASYIDVVPLETGMMDSGPDIGSESYHLITPPKVLLLTGEQCLATSLGEVWNFFDKELGYPISMMNITDFLNLTSKEILDYQVVILPDGNFWELREKGFSEKLKDFVRNGGKLIALQGAVETLSASGWGIKRKETIIEEKDNIDKNGLKRYEDKDKEYLKNKIAGAIFKLNLDNTHPLAYGYPDYYYALKQGTDIYGFLKGGWNIGTVGRDSYQSGLVGQNVNSIINDGLLIGSQDIGSGTVVYFVDDPIYRLFWENGKLMLTNAVFLVGQ